MTSKLISQALSTLKEIVGPDSVGQFILEEKSSAGVLELNFECLQRGYSGWQWVVSYTEGKGKQPPLLAEVNLIAGERALLAPPWVPWADRLAEFRKQLREEGKASSDAEADDLIAGMAFAADDEYSNQTKDESSTADSDTVQKPPRVRVRQRRVKRAEDNQTEQPDPATSEQN